MRLQWVFLVAFAAIICSHSATTQAALTGQYLFEEGSGTTALDSSGFNRDGTLTDGAGTGAPTYTAGLYQGSNSALLFDKNLNDRVALPMNTDFIRNAPGATLMAWIQIEERLPLPEPPAVENFFTTIVQVNNTDTTAFAGFGGARAAISNSLNQGFRAIGSRANEGRVGLNSFSFPEIGVPFFAVGVFDYVGGTQKMYVNGVEVASLNNPAFTGNSADEANLFASIGAPPDPTTATTVAFHGAIDGVRIFDEALDAQTILDTYNAELLMVPPPVLGDYNDDGTVDAADFTVWRDNLGANIMLPNEDPTVTPNMVTQEDYGVWQANFGLPGSGAAQGAVGIPEPTSWMLAFVGLAALAMRMREKATP